MKKFLNPMLGYAVVAVVVAVVVSSRTGVSQVPAQPPLEPPAGTIIAFAGEKDTLPAKYKGVWVLCDGKTSLKVKEHPELFKVIGWTYGYGIDGPTKRTTFQVPDYRGYFLRGAAEDTGRDPNIDSRLEHFNRNKAGGRIGSLQEDALQSHKHPDKGHNHPTNATSPRGKVDSDNSDEKAAPPDPPPASVDKGYADLGDPTNSETGAGDVRHGKETRPKNVYVNWLIKVR